MNKNKFVYMVSLGCPKNLVDTEVIAGVLIREGYGLTSSVENADIYLLNTCSFIKAARDECREFLDEAVKWKKQKEKKGDSGLIVVTGCLIQWDKDKSFRERYSTVDLWITPNKISTIDKYLNKLFSESDKKFFIENNEFSYIYEDSTPRLQLTPGHYAYIKIAEGCDNKCSYCTIPAIRGKLRCRHPDSICKEAKNLIFNGVRELIIVAQDTAGYKYESYNFAGLVKKLDTIVASSAVIRLMYLHPAHIDCELVETIIGSASVLPYLEIPIQHISDSLLKSMNRHTSSEHIRKIISLFREKNPEIALRTTVITGFPGETEDDFQKLYSFIEEIRFDRLGVFVYSPEPGTPAALLENCVPYHIAKRRAEEIMNLQKKISLSENRKLIGKTLKVIIDGYDEDSGYLYGRTFKDAPDIDNCVYITSKKEKRIPSGIFADVVITEVSEYDIFGILH